MGKFLKIFLGVSLLLNVFFIYQLSVEKGDLNSSEDFGYESFYYGLSDLADNFYSISHTFEFYGGEEWPTDKEALLIKQAIDTHINNIENTRSHLVTVMSFNNMDDITDFEEALLNVEKLLGDFVYGGPFYKSEMMAVQDLLISASETINQNIEHEISDEMLENIHEKLMSINEQIETIYKKRGE